MQLHNHPRLQQRRRQLRKTLTPAEAKLWSLLRGSQLDGRKFLRQHSVGPYVLDFYCPSENLAIELDVASHDLDAAAARDVARDAWFARSGIRVLRFENKRVFEDPEAVLEYIRQQFR